MFLTIKLCTQATELFEIELIIWIKMDLVLNNLQNLICHKTHTTKQPWLSLSLSLSLAIVPIGLF